MSSIQPVVELHEQFSSADATATPWAVARATLEAAEMFWVSTVRPDDRPHVTPLVAVWTDGALYFCTGPDERKAKNLAGNSRCVLTTGCNAFREGLDIVVEGEAVRVTDDRLLRRLAARLDAKYDWPFEVRDGAFHHEQGGTALVFEVSPEIVFSYGRGATYSATRYRFREPSLSRQSRTLQGPPAPG